MIYIFSQLTLFMVAPRLTTGCSWTITAPLPPTLQFIDAKVPTLHSFISLALRCSFWKKQTLIFCYW